MCSSVLHTHSKVQIAFVDTYKVENYADTGHFYSGQITTNNECQNTERHGHGFEYPVEALIFSGFFFPIA